MESNCRRHERCVEDAIQQAELVCDENNSRFTTLRKRVLELVWANHEPVKAYDLLSELQKEDESAKPSTIYRTLDFLLELGLVHKIHRQNAFVGCINPKEERPSFFLVCNNCNEVSEKHDEEYYKLIKNISKKHQFKLKESSFEIEGLCNNCI
jgi:Fur family transcriptional regulator, zinc uptake regulator